MITLTEMAANHVKTQLEKRGHGIGIRVGVKPSGCSGMSYVLEFVDAASVLRPLSFQSHGVVVYVNSQDIIFLQGTVIDYVNHGLQEGFEFRNPREQARCGCGESFSV